MHELDYRPLFPLLFFLQRRKAVRATDWSLLMCHEVSSRGHLIYRCMRSRWVIAGYNLSIELHEVDERKYSTTNELLSEENSICQHHLRTVLIQLRTSEFFTACKWRSKWSPCVYYVRPENSNYMLLYKPLQCNLSPLFHSSELTCDTRTFWTKTSASGIQSSPDNGLNLPC